MADKLCRDIDQKSLFVSDWNSGPTFSEGNSYWDFSRSTTVRVSFLP